MKAVRVTQPGAPFEYTDVPIPEPAAGEVQIKVEACGICHSDMFVREGAFPGITYPRIPGHEVVGIISKTGPGVHQWTVGQRVGVGWHGGHCFECEPCRRGEFIDCRNAKICGISYDGGYAEYMTAPQEALASVPESLSSAQAAPLLCAGITVFNAMRNSGVKPGELVAVQGIGGLGHLAIQYAVKMGLRTAAISTSPAKEQLARELGAHYYIDTSKMPAAQALQQWGGAKLIVATAPHADAISSVIDGLGTGGRLLTLAATPEAIQVNTFQLIMGSKGLQGWASGTAMDSEDTLNFSALTGVLPMIEEYPLEKAEEAYQRMMNNQARFRVVIKP